MESEVPNPLDALFLQKQYHYRGRAKISLHNLKFEDEHVACGRTVDPKNIARLVGVFESEGCLRLEAENHIPALIGQTLLGDCLRNSFVSQAALLDFRQDPPFLNLADGQCLVALHGKHRIKAAERFLEPFDRWWLVDLYDSGESPAVALRPALTAVVQIFRRTQCLTHARSTPMRAASAWRCISAPSSLSTCRRLRTSRAMESPEDSTQVSAREAARLSIRCHEQSI